jgi:DNA gyrase/topoisomerase IV subunit B
MQPSYNDDSIVTLKGLDVVRGNPSQFISDTELLGQAHCVLELIANAVDEISLYGGYLKIILCITKDSYVIIVNDSGRGIPLNSLERSYTEMNTSGKYNSDSYETSSGLFGVGAKVAVGLSNRFRVISRRPDGIGSISAICGCHATYPVEENPNPQNTGTIALFEPDPKIFSAIKEFSGGGYIEIVKILEKYCFFSNLDVTLKIIETEIDDTIFFGKTDNLISHISTLDQSAALSFSERDFNRETWLKHYFSLQKPVQWVHQLIGNTKDASDRFLRYSINLYYSKDAGGARFGMINNVNIDVPTSNHISCILPELNKALSQHIESPEISKFVAGGHYKIPIHIAIDCKYKGAKFTGTTKHAFVSAEFRYAYSASIAIQLSTDVSVDALKALYELIKDDIEMRYKDSIGTTTKPGSTKRLADRLAFPDRFSDCSPECGRKGTELFLVEGASAGGGKGRDTSSQSIYMLGGKPYNAIDSSDTSVKSAKDALGRDKAIYGDIFALLDIGNPNNPNFDRMYHEKLILMTDADSHGSHIAAILIGNIANICPKLIQHGHVYIVTPPYYELTYGGKSRVNPRIYLRGADDVSQWLIRTVYKTGIDIHIKSPIHTNATKLTDDEFVGFAKIVLDIGLKIKNIATACRIRPIILELLMYVTEYMKFGSVDTVMINKTIGSDQVFYEEHGDILTVVVGKDDIIIPLTGLREIMYTELMPHLNSIAFRHTQYFATTRHTQTLDMSPVTISMLYELFSNMNELFKTRIFKGLGHMDPMDKYTTCMDPRHRTIHQITDIGDVDVIYKLLGSDPAHRRSLVHKEAD